MTSKLPHTTHLTLILICPTLSLSNNYSTRHLYLTSLPFLLTSFCFVLGNAVTVIHVSSNASEYLSSTHHREYLRTNQKEKSKTFPSQNVIHRQSRPRFAKTNRTKSYLSLFINFSCLLSQAPFVSLSRFSLALSLSNGEAIRLRSVVVVPCGDGDLSKTLRFGEI